ncbi:MAG: hypothetical protein M3493_10950 [Actinomycetota bacterium]|jgi:hypothetical protein|nr:hypothetical protein [Actinomycetota bacterium]
MRFRRSPRGGAVHSDGGNDLPICDMCGMAGPVDLSGHCLLGHYVGVASQETEPLGDDGADGGHPPLADEATDAEPAYQPHDDILSWQDLSGDAERVSPAATTAGATPPPEPAPSPTTKALDELLAWDDAAPASSTLNYAAEEPAAAPDTSPHDEVTPAADHSTGVDHQEGLDADGRTDVDHEQDAVPDDGDDAEDERHVRRRVASIAGATAALTVIAVGAVLVLPF